MKIIERIAQIINSNALSVRAFEIKIGASNGMIGRAISKKTDINAEWLSKIIEALPLTNADWLLTGRGDMLCHADGELTTAQAEPIIIYRDNPDKEEIIALQREHIKLLKEQLTLSPARLDLNVPSTESTPIPSLAGHKRAKTTEKPH